MDCIIFVLGISIWEKYIIVQNILTLVFLIVLLAFKQWIKHSQSQDHLKFKHLTVSLIWAEKFLVHRSEMTQLLTFTIGNYHKNLIKITENFLHLGTASNLKKTCDDEEQQSCT